MASVTNRPAAPQRAWGKKRAVDTHWPSSLHSLALQRHRRRAKGERVATHTAATMPSDQKWLGQLAVLCEAITSDPDAALVKQDHEEPLIKQLQAMADGATSSTRKSRAWLSQCAVFLDVLPAYRVRIASAKEKDQTQTRETQKLRLKEEWPVKAYGVFVSSLSKAAKNRDAEPSLVAVAMRCCGELYARRPSFNLSEDVLRVAAPGLDLSLIHI